MAEAVGRHALDAAVVATIPHGPREATSAEIGRCYAEIGRRVLTFLGYSDSGYEDPRAMLDIARSVLDLHDPASTLVNIGATVGGIGAIYELARQRGFITTGIVSTQARDLAVPLSPFVDVVFFVADAGWGGLVDGVLSPTSQAVVDHSDIAIAIGGNAVARDELEGAIRVGKRAQFFPAEMNHAAARGAAARKGLAPPQDFQGAAGERYGVARRTFPGP